MQRFSRKSRKSQQGRAWPAYLLLGALWLAISAAHKNKMPQNLDDICTIFEDRRDWYAAAKKSEERWGTPTHIQMAIIQQESSFLMPTAMHRRSTALGSGTKTTPVDSMPIEMISTMPSTSSAGIQTCRTKPQVSLNGIPTISISPITKGRLVGSADLTNKRAGLRNRRSVSTFGHDDGRRNYKAARKRWTTPGGCSDLRIKY